MPNKRPTKTAPAAAKRARGDTSSSGSASSAESSAAGAAAAGEAPARRARPGAPSDRETPNADLEADRGESEGLITMVCITCGAEQFFDDAVPSSLTCTRCAGIVFRGFATPTIADEATIDLLESTARSIQYGDSSPQTTADDERELDIGR